MIDWIIVYLDFEINRQNWTYSKRKDHNWYGSAAKAVGQWPERYGSEENSEELGLTGRIDYVGFIPTKPIEF
jgi:hypothetical protein